MLAINCFIFYLKILDIMALTVKESKELVMGVKFYENIYSRSVLEFIFITNHFNCDPVCWVKPVNWPVEQRELSGEWI